MSELEGLVANLKFVEETIEEEVKPKQKKPGPKPKETPPPEKNPEVERRRAELLKLSADGLIKQSVVSINKSSDETINRIYDEYEKRRQERVIEHLCDTTLSRFSQIMGATGSVVSSEKLEEDLKQDPLLRNDVQAALSYVIPWLPLIGVVSGRITVCKHMYESRGENTGKGEEEKE